MIKKLLLYALTFSCLAIGGCKIYILTAEWEKVENYKMSPDKKPSEILNEYLGDKGFAVDPGKKYCIDIFDPYCGVRYRTIPYLKRLYNETRDEYEWVAVTNYSPKQVAHGLDVQIENKCTKKSGLDPEKYRKQITLEYPMYDSIVGLRSSLRNLFHANNPPTDHSSMLVIIVNDSIIRITTFEEPIVNEERYIAFKNYLDSVATSQTTLKQP